MGATGSTGTLARNRPCPGTASVEVVKAHKAARRGSHLLSQRFHGGQEHLCWHLSLVALAFLRSAAQRRAPPPPTRAEQPERSNTACFQEWAPSSTMACVIEKPSCTILSRRWERVPRVGSSWDQGSSLLLVVALAIPARLFSAPFSVSTSDSRNSGSRQNV